MSVTYGFYNSKNGDRKYDAIQMASIFDGIILDGVLEHVGNKLRVTANGEDMTVMVDTGRAWFNHTWTLNDALLPLTVPISEVIQDRIDAVVLEIDSRENVRANSIKIVKGIPSSNPSGPALEQTNPVWQYPLAYIRVNAGVTSIRQANIRNCVGTYLCPYVTAPLEKMNIDDLISQWEDQWQAFFEMQSEDVLNTSEQWKDKMESSESEMNTWKAKNKSAFNSWFSDLQNTLPKSAASALLVDITVPIDGWQGDGGIKSLYLPVSVCTEVAFPVLSLDTASLEIAEKAGLSNCVESLNGMIRLTAVTIPTAPLIGTLLLLQKEPDT